MSDHLLKTALNQFTGTTRYSALCRQVLLTDGALFLAESAGCFWLMDVYASHLLTSIKGDLEPFTVLNLVKQGHAAHVTLDDGNGRVLAEQAIEYTDFPLDHIQLYGCWQDDVWILMLPSEY